MYRLLKRTRRAPVIRWTRNKSKLFSLLVIAAFFGAFFAGAPRTARATTITVTDPGDFTGSCPSTTCTLRIALALAQDGDTINFNLPAGTTIQLLNTLFITRSRLTIAGPGTDALTIRGKEVRFERNGVINAVTIQSLTFDNAPIVVSSAINFTMAGVVMKNTNTLAALLIQDGSATIDGCVFRDNTGSGLFFTSAWNTFSGSLTIRNSGFYVNQSYFGTIYANNDASSVARLNILVEDSIFSGNTNNTTTQEEFGYGGAINLVDESPGGSTAILRRNVFEGNQAIRGGGAIHTDNVALTLGLNSIGNNRAGNGAGLYHTYANATALSLVMDSNTISGNIAAGNGGGIYLNNAFAALYNNTIAGNQASSGAGLITFTSKASIRYNTITGNTATAQVGGVDHSNSIGILELWANIIQGNVSTGQYKDIFAPAGTLSSLGYNIVGVRAGIPGFIAADFPDGTNPQLNGLANNGGSVLTMALKNNSPAIDAISSGSLCQNTFKDARGANRPLGTGFCDIGAYELNVTARRDTIGVYKAGVFYLRNSNTTGGADITVAFGGAVSHLPITGDWNGDGVDTIGIYDTATGVFQLRDANTPGSPNYVFTLGNPGDTPLAGRWDNTMTRDGAGVYRNSNGILYLRRQLTTGFSDYFMILGNPGDTGLAGDWDANGYDSVGVYRPGNTRFYLSNVNGNGITFSDIDFVYYPGSNHLPVSGDWIGTGQSRLGWLSNTGSVQLRHSLTTGATNLNFAYGPTDGKPLAGKWSATVQPPPQAANNPVLGVLVPSGNSDRTNTESQDTAD